MLNTNELRYDLYNIIYFCKIRKWIVINTSFRMDLNAVIDIIIKDLNEARDIIDDLKKFQGVPELQVELAKSKCKSASEMISVLKNVSSEKVSPAIEKKSEVFEPEKEVRKEGPIVAEQIASLPEKDSIPERKEPVEEVKTEIKETRIITVKKNTESTIIADQFSNRPESFNEKLGSLKHDDDVLKILKKKPLSSLNEAIGVNDRFIFIREIFNGDEQSYNEAIIKLESVGSISDAESILMSYTGEDRDDETFNQLMDLIKRKFPSNE